jgi:tRNA(Ile)-lysidine synthase
MPVRRPLESVPEVELIRPLLGTSRVEVLAYCARHHLQPREDATNSWREFLRNRIRHELIPQLETEYAPQLRERLNRLSVLAREDAALLAELTAQRLTSLSVAEDATSVHLSAPGLAGEPAAMRRRILRAAARKVAGHGVELGWDATERLDQLALGARSQAVDLPGGTARVRRVGDALIVECSPASVAPEPFEYPLPLPGVVSHPSANWQISAEVASPPADLSTGVDSAWFDAESITEPLLVRSVRAGDRFQPFGSRGSRKVSDLFIDRKVPRAERGRTPIVVDAEGILWIAGVARSDRARITAATRGAVHLRLMVGD